jgi:hypothetical protein
MKDSSLPAVSLDAFRSFLTSRGFVFRFIAGGYEKWHQPEGGRPVVIRMYQDPVPLFAVRTALRAIGEPEEVLRAFMDQELQ